MAAANAVVHRLSIATTEEKIQSRYLSDSCAYYALLQLAYDKFYAGNQNISLGPNEVCAIDPIPAPSGGIISIQTHAEINQHSTGNLVTINASDLSIISWQEK